jgi:hypothetical protein
MHAALLFPVLPPFLPPLLPSLPSSLSLKARLSPLERPIPGRCRRRCWRVAPRLYAFGRGSSVCLVPRQCLAHRCGRARCCDMVLPPLHHLF